MSPRIKRTDKSLPRVRSTSKRAKRIDPARVASALGAEPAGAEISLKGSPLSLFGLRQELARRLTSTGGRPSLEGTTRRQKIPMHDADWERCEELAERVADQEIRPTAGQVAGILLHQSLEILDIGKLKARVLRRSTSGQGRRGR